MVAIMQRQARIVWLSLIMVIAWPALFCAASDYNGDLDVDGSDLAELASQVSVQTAGAAEVEAFAALFGKILPADAVVSVTVREKAGQTATNLPLTFGHVFSKGDVPNSIAVSANGTLLATQCDVKSRHPDGSVRHAVISVILPQVTAHSDLVLSLVPTTGDTGGTPMTKADILATDIQSLIRLTDLAGCGYSGNLTADLRAAINNQSELTYWLKGDICTEIIVRQALNPSLGALWAVRCYPGAATGFRISHTIENVEADYRGNVSYAVNLDVGHAAPATVYHKGAFQHNCNARWRKVLYQGTAPSEVEIRYDVDYLIASGHIPSYDTGLSIPEDTIQNAYETWLASDRDIMGESIIETYFPTTGDRQEIGILPLWTARYLLSMDNRMRAIMLNLGELSGSLPVHLRESDPSKSFYGHIVSIDDRPTVWLDRTDFQYTAEADRLPDPIGETDTEWHVDLAHQTSFAYVPYLITGEYYFLQEMYFWAGYDLGACNYHSDWGRNYSQGLIRDQVRGEAWAIRVIGQAAALAGDDDPEKAYFETKLTNNIDQWMEETVDNPEAHPLHSWGHVSCRSEDGGRPTDAIVGCTRDPRTGTGSGLYEDIYPIRHTSLPWQDDFMVISLRHLLDLGYPVEDLLAWLGEYTINRFSHPDMNPYNGAPYKLPSTYTMLVDDLSPYYQVATWFQANQAMLDQASDFDSGNYPSSYPYKARAALSCLVHLPGAAAALQWLNGELDNHEALNDDPTWALLPRPQEN